MPMSLWKLRADRNQPSSQPLSLAFFAEFRRLVRVGCSLGPAARTGVVVSNDHAEYRDRRPELVTGHQHLSPSRTWVCVPTSVGCDPSAIKDLQSQAPNVPFQQGIDEIKSLCFCKDNLTVTTHHPDPIMGLCCVSLAPSHSTTEQIH